MWLWTISDFDEGPHRDTAIVRAKTREKAMELLASALDESPRTVGAALEQSAWTVSCQDEDDEERVIFLLGSWCR